MLKGSKIRPTLRLILLDNSETPSTVCTLHNTDRTYSNSPTWYGTNRVVPFAGASPTRPIWSLFSIKKAASPLHLSSPWLVPQTSVCLIHRDLRLRQAELESVIVLVRRLRQPIVAVLAWCKWFVMSPTHTLCYLSQPSPYLDAHPRSLAACRLADRGSVFQSCLLFSLSVWVPRVPSPAGWPVSRRHMAASPLGSSQLIDREVAATS